ncbi:hypothetical protein QFZ89_007851 [Paraburkholderia youngii]
MSLLYSMFCACSLEMDSKRLLRPSEDVPADEGATEFEKCFVNVGPTFEANAKTTEVVKPRMRTFDNPAEFAQTTAVFCPALGDHRLDAALAKFLPMRLGVIATVCVDDLGLLKRPATYAANRWNGVKQRQQLGDVVTIRASEDRADRNAIGVYENVVLGTWSRAIRGVRTSFSPAPTARTDEESTAAREKSSSPASRNFASSSSCNRFHTPAFCQSRNRRQQVDPDPNPNLVDRSRQRIPVLSTNRMPFSAARFATGNRPGYFLRRGLSEGSNGSISVHSSSSTIGAPILGSSCSGGQG